MPNDHASQDNPSTANAPDKAAEEQQAEHNWTDGGYMPPPSTLTTGVAQAATKRAADQEEPAAGCGCAEEEDLVDQSSQESFPASDPPSWTPTSTLGPPCVPGTPGCPEPEPAKVAQD